MTPYGRRCVDKVYFKEQARMYTYNLENFTKFVSCEILGSRRY